MEDNQEKLLEEIANDVKSNAELVENLVNQETDALRNDQVSFFKEGLLKETSTYLEGELKEARMFAATKSSHDKLDTKKKLLELRKGFVDELTAEVTKELKAFAKSDGKCWNEWEDEMKWQPERGQVDLKKYEDEIFYQLFLQYEAFLQWKDIKQYANDLDIEIMGDIPFYVGLDSSDVWSSKENFLLDEDGKPSFIAGVPPDYFSATGQRWGNPIYDWEYMKENEFSFWMERLAYTERLFDIIRVDHFRAFDTYWKINASCPTAVDGERVEAPGYDLFHLLKEKDPDMEIVAEDLGYLRQEVLDLRDHFNFRGMRVIQFSWNSDGMGEDREHLTIYTGTHDNETMDTWYRHFNNHDRRRMRDCLKKMGYVEKSFDSNVIQYTLDSNADIAIIPMCDWLHQNKEGRINTPGTVSTNNWTYRLADFSQYQSVIKDIAKKVKKAKR